MDGRRKRLHSRQDRRSQQIDSEGEAEDWSNAETKQEASSVYSDPADVFTQS